MIGQTNRDYNFIYILILEICLFLAFLEYSLVFGGSAAINVSKRLKYVILSMLHIPKGELEYTVLQF